MSNQLQHIRKAAAPASKTSRRKPRVFMIDDDPEYLEPLKKFLEETGRFEVFVETSPLMALERASQLQPDIIFLDIVMPFYDGGDILLALRKKPSLANVPVVMLSTLISPQEVDSNGLLTSGNQLMMSKPLKPENLLNCIERSLSGELS